MSKPGKSLKGLCKKLGVRLTVKRGKKRVYKSVKVLKAQCKRKQKKKKRKVKKKKKKVKRRRRKFGASLVTNNTIDTSWVALDQSLYNIKEIVTWVPDDTKLYVRYKGAPIPAHDGPGGRGGRRDDNQLGPYPINFSGIVRDCRKYPNFFMIYLTITECHSRPELVGNGVTIYNTRDQISLYPLPPLEEPLPYIKGVKGQVKKFPSLKDLAKWKLSTKQISEVMKHNPYAFY